MDQTIQLIFGGLAAVGTVLGVINILWQWSEKRERLQITVSGKDLLSFRIYNGCSRPIDVRSVSVLLPKTKDRKLREKRESDWRVPIVLNPWMSETYSLTSEIAVDVVFRGKAHIVVKTGSNKTFTKRIPRLST